MRYSADDAAEAVQCGWSRGDSAKAAKEAQQPQPRGAQLGGGGGSAAAGLPEAISLEIVRAPAEYAVPVKQDRRVTSALHFLSLR